MEQFLLILLGYFQHLFSLCKEITGTVLVIISFATIKLTNYSDEK